MMGSHRTATGHSRTPGSRHVTGGGRELRFLDAGNLRFFQAGATLRLTIAGEILWIRVTVLRAFPLSLPTRFFSVRDGGGKESACCRSRPRAGCRSRRLVGRRTGTPVHGGRSFARAGGQGALRHGGLEGRNHRGQPAFHHARSQGTCSAPRAWALSADGTFQKPGTRFGCRETGR